MLGEKIERLIPQRGVAGEFRRGLGAEPQPEPEPAVRRDKLLHAHRLLSDGREVLRPRLAGMDVQAVREMKRWLVLEDHCGSASCWGGSWSS